MSVHAPPRPRVFIENQAVYADKRRLALITIWVPTLGSLAAIALAFHRGVRPIDVALLVGMYIVTMFGVEVGFHRAFSHRAFDAGPAMKRVLAACGSMAAQGGVLYWVATHRRHHGYSDTADDPHSPHWRQGPGGPEKLSPLRGLWHAQMGNMYTDYATNCAFFAKDVARDATLMKVNGEYRRWVLAGVVVPAVIGGAVCGSWYGALSGFLWGGLLRICIAHHCYFTNGSLSHYFGARPFDTGDQSRNNLLCAVPTFGSALQNNHHAFPASAHLGIRAWELDLGSYIVSALERLGLVRNVRGITPDMLAAARTRAALARATPERVSAP